MNEPHEVFPAVDGKKLNVDEFDERCVHYFFRQEIIDNGYRGHLAATLSHIGIFRDIALSSDNEPVVVLEDDVSLVDRFEDQVREQIAKLDPDAWEVLLLGYSCAYDMWGDRCRANDERPLVDGISNVACFVGMWGYVVNGSRAARRILKHMYPVGFIIDHWMAHLNRSGYIRVYGCIPHLAKHPGIIRVDSYGYSVITNIYHYSSDTNAIK